MASLLFRASARVIRSTVPAFALQGALARSHPVEPVRIGNTLQAHFHSAAAYGLFSTARISIGRSKAVRILSVTCRLYSAPPTDDEVVGGVAPPTEPGAPRPSGPRARRASVIKDPDKFERIRTANSESAGQPLRASAFNTAEKYDLDRIARTWPAQAPANLVKDMGSDVYYFKWIDAAELDGTVIYNFGKNVETPKFEENDVFIFQNGTVVIWGLSIEATERFLRRVLRAYEVGRIPQSAEWMEYCYGSTPTVDEDKIVLAHEDVVPPPNLSILQQKLAISIGLSRSVKLETLESLVDRTIVKAREVPAELQELMERRTGPFINRMKWNLWDPLGGLSAERHRYMAIIAELLQCRARLNLHESLTEDPETFWDNAASSEVLGRIMKHLEISKRVNNLNKQLDFSQDLLDVVRTQLDHNHSIKLEWIIILLISVEVVFGTINFVKGINHGPQ